MKEGAVSATAIGNRIVISSEIGNAIGTNGAMVIAQVRMTAGSVAREGAVTGLANLSRIWES